MRLTDLWPHEWIGERIRCRLASAENARANRAAKRSKQARAEAKTFARGEATPTLRLAWDRAKAGNQPAGGWLGLGLAAWRRAEDDPGVMAWLVRHLGESMRWRAACPGVARIALERDGGFEIVGFGEPEAPRAGLPAIIVPALCGGFGAPIRCLDLLAVDPSPPEMVRRASGLVDVLGLAPDGEARAALEAGAPIGVVGSVVAWLQAWTLDPATGAASPRVAGCPAVCVIDPEGPEARELFLSDATLVADSEDTADALAGWIEAARKRALPPKPTIRIADALEEAA